METAGKQLYRVEDELPFLDPVIAQWFNSKYTSLTEPQRRAIPLIHAKNNVLVSSPTGTGKTLTGFLAIINELFLMARSGTLEDKIYCVYISPLKALANDIDKNLKTPLEEIYSILDSKTEPFPKIRVAVRSGDTPQNERQKMLRKPPHIFITTPESLSLVLSAPKFREKLSSVRYLVVDEIHEVSATKRGSLLSINLERLESLTNGLVRIGLSATQAPLETIGNYLCGFSEDRMRPFQIVDVDTKRFLDLSTITPVKDLTQASSEVANDKMYDILAELIETHKTTLIFTNTRSSTEHVAIRLKARGIESIEAHHSSLGKETRIDVENKLKRGELKCVITSTSLELGIDIGYIDLVVQIGSPKSVSKGLQRIGRSGHGINELSKGRFVIFDLDDLMECAVLTKAAYDREIDKVVIPRNPLDVLAQVLVGMSLEKQWDVDEAFKMITRSYSYSTLSREDYVSTLDYLSGSMESGGIYGKIWYDRENNTFGKKKSSRMIYFMNIGTIPDESDFHVINERGKQLGQLSDKFVERLKTGDVFVLGARTYMFLRTSRNRVIVKEAVGMRPTVPSWTGELLPRSYDLGVLIGRFRDEAEKRIKAGENVDEWLMKDYHLDEFGANSLKSYIKAQMEFSVPTERKLLVEGYVDDQENYNAIFHIPLGRRLNDALSRAYALAISNKYSVSTRVTVTDDGFMLTYPKKIPLKSMTNILNAENTVDFVKRSISNTEVFKQRFRHCASRSLMILRKYKGYDISVARQQLRSDKLLRSLEEIDNFPVIKETFNEIFNDMMDVPRAVKYVEEVIDRKKYQINDYRSDTSPFSHGIIISGISDIVLMEDRSKLLRELQSKIIDKMYGGQEIRFLIQDSKISERYFLDKIPKIGSATDIDLFMDHFLYIDPFKSRFNSPAPYSSIPITDLMEEKMAAEELLSVFVRGVQWASRRNYDLCYALFRKDVRLEETEIEFLDACNKSSFNELKEKTGLEENDLKNMIIKMESAYLINRTVESGITRYSKNTVRSTVDHDEALKNALITVLGSYGPLTLDEMLIKIPLDSSLVENSLNKLVGSGLVIYDYITPVFSKQYILKTDLENMLSLEKIDVTSSRVDKFLRVFKSEEEYFDNMGFFCDFWDLRQRVPAATESGVDDLVLSGKIMKTRMIKKRDCYVSRELVIALHSLRYENASESENELFSMIQKGVNTEKDLEKFTGMERRTLRQSLSIMEYRGVIRRNDDRTFVEFLGFSDPVPQEDAIRVILRLYGPISVKEIRNNFWFNPTVLSRMNVEQSYRNGEIYYGIEQIHADRNSMLLTMKDPSSVYFEGNYFGYTGLNARIIARGHEVADFTMDNNRQIIVISNLEVKTDLAEFITTLKEAMEYNHIKAALASGEPEIVEQAAMLGESTMGQYISFSNMPMLELTESGLLLYAAGRFLTFSKQKSSMYPFLKERYLGIRNDIEGSLLGLKGPMLDSYFRSKLLFTFYGPYHINAMGTIEAASLFRALRNYQLTQNDREVIRIVLENGSVGEMEILRNLKTGILGSRVMIKRLYEMCVLAKDSDHKFIYVPEKFKRLEAVELILRETLKLLGFFDYDRLERMIGPIQDEEFFTIIEKLIKEGAVEEFVSPDMGRIVYTCSDLAKKNGRTQKKDGISIIISPKDLISLYFNDYIKSRFGSGNMFYYLTDGELKIAFSGRKKGRLIDVRKIVGDRTYRDQIKKEMNLLGHAVTFN